MMMKISVCSLVLLSAALRLLVVEARFDRSFRLSDPYDFFRPTPRTRTEQDRRLPPPARGGEYPPYKDRLATLTKQELLESNNNGNATAAPMNSTTSVASKKTTKSAAAATQQDQVTTRFVPKFRGAAWMSFFNILLFTFRPDPDVSWPSRVPRIVWEVALYWNLCRASHNDTSPFYLWLSFLTGSTGLVDLFIWAPVYGAFVNFQSCEGGWLQPKTCRLDPLKGYSRLAVAVQSIIGGLVYLHAALQAMHAIYDKRAAALEKKQQEQQQAMWAALPPPPPPHRYERPLPYDPRDPHYRYRR